MGEARQVKKSSNIKPLRPDQRFLQNTVFSHFATYYDIIMR